MTEILFAPDWFSKPGDTLSLLLDRKKYSPEILAEKMGYSASFIHGLLSGTVSIDEKIAILLEKHVGGPASFWIRRQNQFTQSLEKIVNAIPSDHAKTWLKRLPTREMIKSGWLPEVRDNKEIFKALLTFFGVSSPDEWEKRYTDFGNMFSFRTSPTFESKIGPLSAWLRQGEIQAAALHCSAWNAKNFKDSLVEIRGLTKVKNPSYFMPRLRQICSEAGVAVVFIPAPSGCRASGAARFISSHKAMISLSFRYLSDDHFWFSFFHEAGHILLHGKTSISIDDETFERNEKENEANKFSSGILIPCDRLEEFMNLPAKAKSILRFSASIGISPGIVVGQMQHNHIIGPKELNFLKRRYSREQILEVISTL